MIRKLINNVQRCIWVAVLPILLIGCGYQMTPSQNSSPLDTTMKPSSSDTSVGENKPSNTISSYDLTSPPLGSAPSLETKPSLEAATPTDVKASSSQASSEAPPEINMQGALQPTQSSIIPSSEIPIVTSAVLKQGIPDGFVAKLSEGTLEGTFHIEALVKSSTPQMYKFILKMDDIPQPIMVRTYKSTNHPSHGGDNVCLSLPFELTPEVIAALISNPNARISLSLVAMYNKVDFSAASDPLYLDESKERFLPAKP